MPLGGPTEKEQTQNAGRTDLPVGSTQPECDDSSQPKIPWDTILECGNMYDGKLVDKWKDEMTNLLIIAGLLSAAITPFAVESYKLLEEDPEDRSVMLLAQISGQLSLLVNATGSVNSTTPTSSSSKFIPSEMIIRLNILWMVSLTLALVSSAFAITVQQWLRHFMPPQHLSTQEAACLRQWRYDALLAWQVPNIINLLPLVIQISVILFVAGLLVLLYMLNGTVARAVAGVGGLALVLFIAATIFPLVSNRCPYKTPLIPATIVALQGCAAIVVALCMLISRLVILAVKYFLKYNVVGSEKKVIRWMQSSVRWITPHLDVSGSDLWVNREREALSKIELDIRDIPAVAWGIATTSGQDLPALKEVFATHSREWKRKCIIQVMANAIGCPLPIRPLSPIYYFYPDDTHPKRLLRRIASTKSSTLGMFVRAEYIDFFVEGLPLASKDEWVKTYRDEEAIAVLLLLLRVALAAEECSPNIRQQIQPNTVRTLLDARDAVELALSDYDSTSVPSPSSSDYTEADRFWAMRSPAVLLYLYDLGVDESIEVVAWSSAMSNFAYEFDKQLLFADTTAGLAALASLPLGTPLFEGWAAVCARELCSAFAVFVEKKESLEDDPQDPLSVIPASVNRIRRSLEQLQRSGRVRQNDAERVFQYLPLGQGQAALQDVHAVPEAASQGLPNPHEAVSTVHHTSPAIEDGPHRDRHGAEEATDENGPSFPESGSTAELVDISSTNPIQDRYIGVREADDQGAPNFSEAESGVEPADFAIPNPTRGRDLNFIDAIHADFSLTSKRLGMEPKDMCNYLDQLYDIMHNDGQDSMDASIPQDWQFRCVANGMWGQFKQIHSARPLLLRYLAERLAQDLKQLLDQPWPDHSLDEASACFIMRIVAICAVMAYVIDDPRCIEYFGTAVTQMLNKPSPGLPSLRSSLLRPRLNLATLLRSLTNQPTPMLLPPLSADPNTAEGPAPMQSYYVDVRETNAANDGQESPTATTVRYPVEGHASSSRFDDAMHTSSGDAQVLEEHSMSVNVPRPVVDKPITTTSLEPQPYLQVHATAAHGSRDDIEQGTQLHGLNRNRGPERGGPSQSFAGAGAALAGSMGWPSFTSQSMYPEAADRTYVVPFPAIAQSSMVTGNADRSTPPKIAVESPANDENDA